MIPSSTTVLVVATIFLGLAQLASADLVDNQVDDFQQRQAALRQFQRPPRTRRPMLKKCNECGPDQCQVMGMQRYAEPRCEAFGDLGAPCRMWQEAENKTLHYPEAIVKCSNVYMQLCPCARGLVCEEAECRYARPAGGAHSQQQQRPSATKLLRFRDDEHEPSTVAGLWPATSVPGTRERMLSPSDSELVDPRVVFGGSRRTQWPWAVSGLRSVD